MSEEKENLFAPVPIVGRGQCRVQTRHPASEDGKNGIPWVGGYTDCGRAAEFFSPTAGAYVCRSHFKHAEGRAPIG